jgi:hypothetical protein
VVAVGPSAHVARQIVSWKGSFQAILVELPVGNGHDASVVPQDVNFSDLVTVGDSLSKAPYLFQVGEIQRHVADFGVGCWTCYCRRIRWIALA